MPDCQITPITQISKNGSQKKNGNCMLNALPVLGDSMIVNVSLLAIAYSSISACTSSSWLAKRDRPMIKSPGLVTLDHSLCMYCKTIWSSLTHTLLWCIAANWSKAREGIFGTHHQLSLSRSSSSFANNNWRALIYVATNQRNCKCEGHVMPCPDHLEIPPIPYWQSCWMCLRLPTHQQYVT